MKKEALTMEFAEKYRTVPLDTRFTNTNQTRNCHQNFLDFQRCSNVRGEDYEACQYFKRVYKIICPNAWIEKWDEQIANNTFAGRI
ncbi:cytochrome c oxidase subunit 6B1 isoform X2 [Fopius arisanus]|nr:PREDICTED: cytochrome c oxidase subunit 6B1 isoform X2 [Fopius arisanus]